MAQALVVDFSHLKIDFNKAYSICMSVLPKPLIKSKITLKNRLNAKVTPFFLDDLAELGLIERVILPTTSTSGRGLVVEINF